MQLVVFLKSHSLYIYEYDLDDVVVAPSFSFLLHTFHYFLPGATEAFSFVEGTCMRN